MVTMGYELIFFEKIVSTCVNNASHFALQPHSDSLPVLRILHVGGKGEVVECSDGILEGWVVENRLALGVNAELHAIILFGDNYAGTVVLCDL